MSLKKHNDIPKIFKCKAEGKQTKVTTISSAYFMWKGTFRILFLTVCKNEKLRESARFCYCTPKSTRNTFSLDS